MKRVYPLLALILLPFLAAFGQAAGLELNATNHPPSITTTNSWPAPETTTNVAPPSSVTNLPPPVVSPKPTSTINGSTLMTAFGNMPGGRFGVSGRTLKLPVTDLGTNAVSPDAWRRTLEYGMTLTQGNSDTLRYWLGLDALKERDADLFHFRARGSYGESESKTDTENAVASMRYERKLTDLSYALGNVEWMTDPVADLNYRVATILSPGFHLIRTEESLLNVEAGAGYLTEKKNEDEQGFLAGRFAITFEQVLNMHVMAWGSAEYLPKLLDASVFFINAELGIATVLGRNLSLTVSLLDRYDSAPSDDKRGNDSILTTALNLNF